MAGPMKRFFESVFLSLILIVPARVMSHMMFLFKGRPEITDHWGWHARAAHYYEPLPDFRNITSAQLDKPRVSPAIDFRIDEQRVLLRRLGAKYAAEMREIRQVPEPEGFDFTNSYFTSLDASVYHALIRDLKPANVIEIASGYSTQIASQAQARNEADGIPRRLLCIEPWPEARLTGAYMTYFFRQIIRRTGCCPSVWPSTSNILSRHSSLSILNSPYRWRICRWRVATERARLFFDGALSISPPASF